MGPGLCQPLDRTPSFKRVVALVVELVDKCDDRQVEQPAHLDEAAGLLFAGPAMGIMA